MSATKRLLIIGAGGHGISVAEAAKLSGMYEVIGFLDDSLANNAKKETLAVLGTASDLNKYAQLCDEVIIAIGNNAVRESLVTKAIQAGLVLATVTHPSAIISPTAVIASGCAIMAGAIIGTEAKLGLGVIVNCGAIVDHHSTVADFGHLGVNACMAGGSFLGRAAWMQIGCSLGYGVSVHDGVVLMPGVSLSSTNKQSV